MSDVRSRTPFDVAADYLAVPAHDAVIARAIGLTLTGALILLYAANRLTNGVPS